MNRIIFLLWLLVSISLISGQRAVFIKPYSNLFRSQLSTFGKNFEYFYTNPSLSGHIKKYGCMRAGHALFNESCKTIRGNGKEVLVEFESMVLDSSSKKPCPDRFWTLRKNLLFEDDATFNTFCFPKPVSYKNPASLWDSNVIVLLDPFKNEKTGITYPACTRFVRNKKMDTSQFFCVVYFHDGICDQMMVPKSGAVIAKKRTPKEQRALFLDLLKRWTSSKKRIIPYAWGGSAYMEKIDDEGFFVEDGEFFNTKTKHWKRPNFDRVSGFDCSGLVLRAAQTVGIPYFYKTTSAAYRLGSSLGRSQKIEPGDVLVWPGHIIVLSGDDMFSESTGYSSGYGSVCRHKLSQRIKDVKTLDDLQKRYEQNAGLVYLNKDGKSRVFVRDFKVLRIV